MINTEQNTIDEIINDLTLSLRSKQSYILTKIANSIGEQKFTFQQFNGRFGGKNNTYVDSVKTQFLDFDDFYAQWLKGLIDKYEEDMEHHTSRPKTLSYPRASIRNLNLLKDTEIESYVKVFLERNFYKHIKERTRQKPDESLWSIWFGNNLIYGMLIAPTIRSGFWTNDKSEIRRTNYAYWTVGHILSEGLIDPNTDHPYKFSGIKELKQFYRSVLKKLSSSVYEQIFCDKYLAYLDLSKNVEDEPFLIPEVRYAGLQQKHKYRLDFTVLNSHTFEYTGFEISPASSHIAVSKLKEKQVIVNEELKEKWNKEMQKRNDYFETFGITTITFSDAMLINIDECFEIVRQKLSSRLPNKVEINSQLERLKNIS